MAMSVTNSFSGLVLFCLFLIVSPAVANPSTLPRYKLCSPSERLSWESRAAAIAGGEAVTDLDVAPCYQVESRYGNNNIDHGRNNRIYGNNNILYGSNNVLYGNNNIVRGSNNVIYGNNNIVNGNNRIVNGNHQIIN